MLLATVVACAIADGSFAEDPARAFVPIGERTATIMATGLSPRCAELGERFRSAIRKAPDWLVEQAKKAPAGGPVPYDTRMGLTRSEYEELLKCSRAMTMLKTGETRLRVATDDGRVFRFSTSTPELGLDGIELDLVKNEVRSPLGVARDRTKILADSTRESPTGPWDGHSWKGTPGLKRTDSVSTMTGSSVLFSLGRRFDGEGILYYNATKVENGTRTARFTTILYYPLNPKGTTNTAPRRSAPASR